MLMFDHLVELTEPVCQAIDTARASMTIFDTSGIEAYVQENNPKYADSIIKRLKAWKKAVGAPKHYDPYKATYASMPPHAFANPEVKQMYINGHFCYAYKFGIVTNGLGYAATHADLLLAGITQQITVLLADRIHKHQYIRSLRPLIVA
jgi:hypothetical protein